MYLELDFSSSVLYMEYNGHIVSLLAEDDEIANTLKAHGIKTQTIKEVQETQSNPIQVLAAKHLGLAYQSMGKMGIN